MKKWTMKEIVRSKFQLVILLTVLLTLLATKLINKLFTRSVTLESGFIHTSHFSLSVPMILLLSLPVSFISVIFIQLFMNTFKQSQGQSRKERLEFTWYSLYGTFLGFLIFVGLVKLLSNWYSPTDITLFSEGLLWVGLIFLAPLVGVVLFVIVLNRIMIRVTRTNHTIITEIKHKQHEDYFQSAEVKNRVIQVLRRGRASTITGAIKYIKATALFRRALTFSLGFFFRIFKTLWRLLSTFGGSSQGGGSSYQPIHSSSSDGDSAWEREQAKKEAMYQARQKQKQADYTARHFANQFNYNAKYSQGEWNRYKQDQRKANEARKRANRM